MANSSARLLAVKRHRSEFLCFDAFKDARRKTSSVQSFIVFALESYDQFALFHVIYDQISVGGYKFEITFFEFVVCL